MPQTAWRPTRATALLLAVPTIWPLIYMGLFLLVFASAFWSFNSSSGGDGPALFRYIFPAHILTMLLTFVLLAVYIVHLFRTDLIPQQQKALWAVVMFFGNAIVLPIYWYLYVWLPVRGTRA